MMMMMMMRINRMTMITKMIRIMSGPGCDAGRPSSDLAPDIRCNRVIGHRFSC